VPTKLASPPASGILDLAQHGSDVEPAVDEPEGAAAHGRDERDLVAVGELVSSLRVAPVHGIEEPRRLGPEVEGGPDVLDARDVLQLDARTPGAFPKAGEGGGR